ncbi:MAG: cupin protein [Frankiales bacterium]|nr:cupin protein [Frankiales bacterium]
MPDTDATRLAPVVRSADEGQRRWFHGGGVHVWKATQAETGGAFILFEDQMTAGKCSPLHVHPDSDETFYVVDGEIAVHLDGTQHRLSAGAVMVAPRGVPHAFLVLTPTARVLCLHTPGSCEAFYWDASEPLAAGASDGPVDMERVRLSAARNGGMVIVGPPPFPQPE